MPRYLVERSFPDGFRLPTDGEGAQRYLDVVDRNADDGVTWLHSYVSDDRTRTFCLYDGPTPEAIRKTAARNRLPSTGSPRCASSIRTSTRPMEVMNDKVDRAFRRDGRWPSLRRPAPSRWCSPRAPAVQRVRQRRQQLLRRHRDHRPQRPRDRVGRDEGALRQGAGRSAPASTTGCSLYLLTSDQLHELTGSHYRVQRRLQRDRLSRATHSSGRRS